MCKIREMIRKAKSVLESKVGEGYIDTAVKMIIAVVIEQCLPAFRQPIYGVFDEFLGKIEDVSPDVVGAIAQMKNQIDNDIFREWCDQLIACQSDSTLKDTLPAIVEKLTAVRLVNSEMRIPLSEARREYYLMVAITVANIPLLYFINQEWYEMLMYSVVSEDEEEHCIADLKELKRILEDSPDRLLSADTELMKKIVTMIYAEQDGGVTYVLTGGLEMKIREVAKWH